MARLSNIDAVSDQIDTTTVHPARRYNDWLGGNDHFAVDRASGDEILQQFPTARLAALENRRADTEPAPRPDPAHVAVYRAVGRKP
jgi:hypothetical protein